MGKYPFDCSKEDIADTLDYRGIHLDFFIDDAGQQFYTYFNKEIISFGAYNSCYKKDGKYIIDKFLDNIPINNWDYKSPYFGSQLNWFKNKETNKWNIRLTYRSNEVKVWDEPFACPITGDVPPTLSMEGIIKVMTDSEKILDNYIKK